VQCRALANVALLWYLQQADYMQQDDPKMKAMIDYLKAYPVNNREALLGFMRS
jgi:hypothetical protein